MRLTLPSPGTANQRRDSARDAPASLPRCGPARPSIALRSVGPTRFWISSKRHPISPSRTSSVATSCSNPTYLNVFTVEEFESTGKKARSWTKIGAAFPDKEGIGFSIELKAFPVDGRLVVLPPDSDDRSNE